MYTKQQILFRFLRENKVLTLVTLLSGFLASLLFILLPVSLGKYFELLFGTGSKRAHFLDWLPTSWMSDVPAFLLFFLGMIVLRTVFHFIQRYGTGLLGERFAQQVREQLFQHQLRVHTAIYDKGGIGKYLLRYSGDLQGLQNYLNTGIIQFAIDALLLAISLGFMAWLSPVILAVVLTFFLLTAIVVFLMNKRLSFVTERRRGTRSELLTFVNERLISAVTLKAFNKEVPEVQKFGKKSAQLYADGNSFQRGYSFIYALVPGLVYFGLAATLFAIYLLKKQGANFDSGSTLSFVLLFVTILPVLRRMYRANSVWEMGNVSFQKLIKVLDLESEQQDLPSFKFKKGKIELRALGFGYTRKKMMFSGLTMTIPPSSITVLMAPNGFGKSTLVKLMMGIYPVSEGKLIVDGQDASQVDLKSLRRSITAVSDGFSLIGETVFEAISYSRKPEKRPAAALMLEALQMGLPPETQVSLDKKIGEQGIRLAAGQRKLLQYARAFLSEKPILLVDEPFADLSAEARINIVRKLTEKKSERTTILLASDWNHSWIQPDHVIELDKPSAQKQFSKLQDDENG